MPIDEEASALLKAVFDYWTVSKNPDARYVNPLRRSFHSGGNYAILLGLLNTTSRITDKQGMREHPLISFYQRKIVLRRWFNER